MFIYLQNTGDADTSSNSVVVTNLTAEGNTVSGKVCRGWAKVNTCRHFSFAETFKLGGACWGPTLPIPRRTLILDAGPQATGGGVSIVVISNGNGNVSNTDIDLSGILAANNWAGSLQCAHSQAAKFKFPLLVPYSRPQAQAHPCIFFLQGARVEEAFSSQSSPPPLRHCGTQASQLSMLS